MSFWQATMKRSVRLSRTYFIMGVLMSVFGATISNVYSLIPADLLNIEGASIDLVNSMPLVSVSFLSLSALMFLTRIQGFLRIFFQQVSVNLMFSRVTRRLHCH